jgi:NAD(P)-dependent dehydrogenase (short-subunit alcohol dehydrogenase family)
MTTSAAPEVTLVTGASRGIGYATAARLVARGGKVAITGRNSERLEAAAKELGSERQVLFIAGDSADPSHRSSAVATVMDRFGRIDALVNNTGINPLFGPLAEADLEAVGRIFMTNVVGALGWTQEVYRAAMQAEGGTIVNVASAAGLRSADGIGAYGASKAALIHLTRQLAAELGPGVRVNAVAPAVVRTRFARALYSDRETDVASGYPLGRIGTPEDVAGAIAFLVSPEAEWISGETLVLDGGLLSVSAIES